MCDTCCNPKKCLQIGKIWLCHYEPKSKRIQGMETGWHSIKEKVLDAIDSKKRGGLADSLLVHEMTHLNWLPWKKCNWKQYFLLPIPLRKFTLFIYWPTYIYIYIYMEKLLEKWINQNTCNGFKNPLSVFRFFHLFFFSFVGFTKSTISPYIYAYVVRLFGIFINEV